MSRASELVPCEDCTEDALCTHHVKHEVLGNAVSAIATAAQHMGLDTFCIASELVRIAAHGVLVEGKTREEFTEFCQLLFDEMNDDDIAEVRREHEKKRRVAAH